VTGRRYTGGRRSPLIATLILSVLAQPARTLTFSHPCASSAVVLEALGKELGVAMKPGGSVVRDFVVVRIEDAPVDEALERVAKALNATWTQQSGVHVLTRLPAQETKERQETRAARAKLIQDWLDKRKVEGQVTLENSRELIEAVLPLLKANTSQSFNQQAFEQQRALEARGPMARLLTRLLKEIGAEAIAELEEGERAQWVERPNPRQRQLPQGQAFAQFKVENEIYKEALMRSGALDRLGEEGMMSSSLLHPYMPRHMQESRTMLTVTRRRNYFSVRLELGDAGQVNEAITPDRRTPDGMPKELSEQQGEYEATAVEKELGRAAAVIFGGRGEPVPVGAEAVRVLNDPVANEPLTVFGSKWLLDASKGLGRNLVAVVSDDSYLASLFVASQGTLGYATFWQVLPQMGTGYNVALDEKWLTIYPKDAAAVREQRLDREAWRRAIARLKPGQSAGLEDYAAYASLSSDENHVMIATLPAMFLGHGIEMENMLSGANLEALRLYGGLTALQQKAARNGGAELLLSRLPAPMERAATRIVFEENGRINANRKPVGWGSPNTYEFDRENSDPMVALARGYPPASVVRLYVLRDDVVHQQDEAGNSWAEGVLPDAIAQMIVGAEVWPEAYANRRAMYAVAPAEQLLIEFEFTNLGYKTHRIQVDFLPKDAVYRPLAELPEAVRNEIEAGVKKYRELYKNVRRDGGGGG
jgi:hypothetical protein